MSAAASEWSSKLPNKGGAYLIFYVGDWFPEGDVNNHKFELVDVVQRDGEFTVLADGRFLSAEEMRGWKFAKIIGPEIKEPVTSPAPPAS